MSRVTEFVRGESVGAHFERRRGPTFALHRCERPLDEADLEVLKQVSVPRRKASGEEG